MRGGESHDAHSRTTNSPAITPTVSPFAMLKPTHHHSGQQNDAEPDRHTDPRRRADEGERRAVMQAVHGRKHRHAMQGDPVQHVFQKCPEHQARRAGSEPFPAASQVNCLKLTAVSATTVIG